MTIKLRRGFKTEAEQLAVEIRQDLGLDVDSPLCPWKLAEHLSIEIHTLGSIRDREPNAYSYLSTVGREYFSAVTLFGGSTGNIRVIYHNEFHALPRQRSNLAHELAHAILLHTPTEIFCCDPTAEEEAKWLGPALLVPRGAAVRLAINRVSPSAAAETYGVSVDLMRMRLNVTGAIRIASRSA
jgi:hypothetical protein